MYNYSAIRRFLEDLRVNGFSIGVVEEQRVIELLVRLQNAGSVPASAERLCGMLGPVLCCTDDQQKRFRTRFDAHFSSWSLALEPPPLPPTPNDDRTTGERGSKVPDLLEFWRLIPLQDRRQIIRRAVITLFGAIIIFYVIPTALERVGLIHRPERPVRPEIVVVSPPQADPAALKGVDRLGRQASVLTNQASDVVSRTLAGPRAAWQQLQLGLGPFTFFTLTAPFMLAGAWIAAPGRRRTGYISRREARARPAFTELLINTRRDDLLGQHASPRKLQPLRRPRAATSTEIDVDACIPRMLENGGFFEPVFRQRLIAPEYLVLIDRRGAGDHIARCGEALAQAMRAANVYVDVYWFDRDPRRLFLSLDAPSMSLEEVAGRHGEHRLIFIASGERLFDWASGAIEPWAMILRQFPRRVMLTPAALELWGYRERAIFSALAMPVLPLSASAIDDMVEILASEELPRPTSRTAEPQSETEAEIELADLLEERPVRWLVASPPSQAEQEELVTKLRDALPDLEWRWLSACAVYPQLIWKLTLFLGLPIHQSEHDRRSFFDQVAALGRLPWLRTGLMPVWLRQWLTRLMDEEEYRRIDRILSKLLLTTLQPRRSSTPLSIGDDRRAKGRMEADLKDEVLVDFLSGPPSHRTSVPLPDDIASRFGHSKAAGGLLRPIFSSRRSQEIRSDATLVKDVLTEVGAAFVEVRLSEQTDDLGPDYRVVERLLTKTGDALPGDGLILYLPAGNRLAYVVNDWTVDLHRRIRKLAFRLGLANFVLVLLSLIIFYGNPDRRATNVAFDLLLAMSWIAVPLPAYSSALLLLLLSC